MEVKYLEDVKYGLTLIIIIFIGFLLFTPTYYNNKIHGVEKEKKDDSSSKDLLCKIAPYAGLVGDPIIGGLGIIVKIFLCKELE